MALDIEKALKGAREAWAQGDTLNDQLLEQVYVKGKVPGEMTTALVQAQYLRSISLSLLVIAETRNKQMPLALEPDEAWSDGEHTVRLWIARQPGALSTVTYGRADKPAFVDIYKNEGDARLRYEDLVTRYEAAGKGNP